MKKKDPTSCLALGGTRSSAYMGNFIEASCDLQDVFALEMRDRGISCHLVLSADPHAHQQSEQDMV